MLGVLAGFSLSSIYAYLIILADKVIPGIIVGSAGIALKSTWDQCMDRTAVDRAGVSVAYTSAQEIGERIVVRSDAQIANPRVVRAVTLILKLTQGGLYVIGGPAGVGKTSYLTQAIKELQASRFGTKFLYMRGFSKELLHANLKVDPKTIVTSYSDLFRQYTVLVIDQLDIDLAEWLKTDHRSILRTLATDSVNNKTFHCIVCVSNAEVMKDILSLNHGEKIDGAFHSSLFQWNHLQCLKLIQALARDWSRTDQEYLCGLYEASLSPGTICKAISSLVVKHPNGLPTNPLVIENMRFVAEEVVRGKQEEWSEFKSVDHHLYFIFGPEEEKEYSEPNMEVNSEI